MNLGCVGLGAAFIILGPLLARPLLSGPYCCGLNGVLPINLNGLLYEFRISYCCHVIKCWGRPATFEAYGI
jgi:hypothetical protein